MGKHIQNVVENAPRRLERKKWDFQEPIQSLTLWQAAGETRVHLASYYPADSSPGLASLAASSLWGNSNPGKNSSVPQQDKGGIQL
jgi:hypothetical protein